MRTRQALSAPRAPKKVVGFHGCHIDVALRILEGEEFQHSINDYDWLGSGVYFWEYAPDRALEWAQARFGENAAVVEATLALDNCVNLLDTTHFEHLEGAYSQVVEAFRRDQVRLPLNLRGRHALDKIVLDTYCKDLAKIAGKPVDSVRGCFPEGDPVFPGSKVLRYTHIQIAVLNHERCISNLKLVHFK